MFIYIQLEYKSEAVSVIFFNQVCLEQSASKLVLVGLRWNQHQIFYAQKNIFFFNFTLFWMACKVVLQLVYTFFFYKNQ